MSSLFDTVFQSIKNKYPTIKWSLGSVVRTLLVDPLTSLSEEIDKYTAELERTYDLPSILEDPAANEEQLDIWIERLGLTIPDNTAATGTVVLTLTSAEQITISENVTFTWGDNVLLRATGTTIWGGVGGTPMTRVATGLYKIEIPVTTGDDFQFTLSPGTPINWDNAPDTVQEIYVGSAITGGFSTTPAAKAAILSNALTEPSTCGRSSILTGLVRQFGSVVADVFPGARLENKGSSGASLYLKQVERPREVAVEATPTQDGYNYTCAVNTSGVLKILSVVSANGVELDITNVTSSGTLGDYDSYATITAATTKAVTLPLTIKMLKYSVIADCAQWLNAYQIGSPAKMVVHVPGLAEVHMQLHLQGGELPNSVAQTIADYVNRNRLGSTITDSAIDSILTAAGLTRTQPTLFYAKIDYGYYSNVVSDSGSLSLSSVLGLVDVPVAMYCSAGDIEVA